MMMVMMMVMMMMMMMVMMVMIMMVMMMILTTAEKSSCWNRPGRQMKLSRNHKKDQRNKTKQGHR